MTEIPAIETEGLTKRFGEFTAVADLDLRVDTGTVVSLLGSNGAGKTTTVRMLATLSRPDSGSARVAGHDVVHEAAQVRRLISLTGQFAALDKHLTARENLVLMARLRGRTRRDSADVTERLIDRFAIEEFRNRLVKNQSGGERRRVDLAASLIDTPHVLVLDEPTTGLDPRSRQVVWSTIRSLVDEGVTLLLTTQYLEEADALADRVVLIDRGREVASGTPAQLKAQVGAQRVDVIAADGAEFERLGSLLGEQFEISASSEQRTISVAAPDEAEDLARVAAAVAEADVAVDEIALRRPTLDDAFLALTGHMAREDPRSDSRSNESQPTEVAA
ncbi:MAG: ATP-binding cassette domain-containing protein [Solirubrobacteraceae bacterium]